MRYEKVQDCFARNFYCPFCRQSGFNRLQGHFPEIQRFGAVGDICRDMRDNIHEPVDQG